MMVNIDFREKRPLYEQISSRIEEQIIRGIMLPDEALPSVRNLAVELSINPNTVQKAYADLEQKGLTYSVSGRGSFVSNVENLLPVKREEALTELDRVVTRALSLGIEGGVIVDRVQRRIDK